MDVLQSRLTSRVSGSGTLGSLCGEGTGDFPRSRLSLHFHAQGFPPLRLWITVLYVAGSKREKHTRICKLQQQSCYPEYYIHPSQEGN